VSITIVSMAQTFNNSDTDDIDPDKNNS